MFRGNGRFDVRRLLGRGTLGVVYQAHDGETDADVALKTLGRVDADDLYRLKQEFRALAGIRHPHLVELYELFVDEHEAFFTMELVAGTGVLQYVGDARSDVTRVRAVARQVAAGLAALHARGKLHRDVKPSILMVTTDGRAIVLDFGLVTALDRTAARETRAATMAGTLAYMAPEQAWGLEVGPAADWYALGTVLFEALTASLPFDGSPVHVLQAKAESPAPSPRGRRADIPPDLDALVRRLLDPDPNRRPDVDTILETLRPTVAPPTRTRSDTPRHRGPAPFVGRGRELARLLAARDDVRAGRPAVVRIQGPSGIGKSELVRRCLTLIETDGDCVVLRGRCHEQEAVPYKALDEIVDGLSRVLTMRPARDAERLVPTDSTALVRLFPVLGRVPAFRDTDALPGDAEPSFIRQRGYAGFRSLLTRLASERLLVVWIDDFQWGDLDSAGLLRETLRGPDTPPILLVITFRSEDTDVPVLQALDEAVRTMAPGSVHDIGLGPLDASDADELARRLAHHLGVPESRILRHREHAGGSPFLITELARALDTTGGEPRADDVGIADLLGARIRQLQASDADLLEIVSIARAPLARGTALRAAGLAERDRNIVASLANDCLLRTTLAGNQPTVELYHDRLREAVLGRMSAARLRTRHREIADALRDLGPRDPEIIGEHYLAAGERALAGTYIVEAAEQSAATLAFDRTTRLFRRALDLAPAGTERWRLHVGLGESLANAGRGGEAASSFEDAASELDAIDGGRDDVLELRRRSADQWVRSGHLDRGVTLLRDILAAVGVSMPRSNGRALAASLVQRARFVLRGLRSHPRDVPSTVRVRLDACWTAATGLSVVEPIVADGLGVRCLIEALQAGARTHVVRALGLEAARESALGGPLFSRRSRRLLEHVERLALESGDPYDTAWMHQSIGTTAYFRAEWPVARERCDAAVDIWRRACRGAAWEIVTGESFALTALAHMGELAALSARLPAALAEADERGDLYASTSFRMGVLAFVGLAQDRPDSVREAADAAIARWPNTGFLVQHYLHLLATVHTALYVGDAWRALRDMEAAWPRLRAAHILVIGSTRVELRFLRARVALAAIAAGHEAGVAPNPGWPRARLLRIARGELRALERETIPSAAPFTALLRSALLVQDGRTSDALTALQHAADDAERAGMRLHAAIARCRAGVIRGGEGGHAQREAASRWMRDQGITRPDAFALMLAP
jgi:hypothetical protein